MSRFVLAFGNEIRGYPRINLDFVAVMRPVRKDKQIVGWACFSESGDEVGTIGPHEDITPLPVVTADTTGTIAVVFDLDSTGAVTTTRFPIIAWEHARHGCACPQTVIGLDQIGVVWCFELRTGVWVFPEDADFTSLDEAIAHARTYLEAALPARESA